MHFSEEKRKQDTFTATQKKKSYFLLFLETERKREKDARDIC